MRFGAKINVFFIRDMRIIVAVQLKGCVVGASIFCIIIDQFNYWKEFCPIVLLKVDKDLEIDFHYTVLPFSLAVNLRVKGSKKSLLNVQEGA